MTMPNLSAWGTNETTLWLDENFLSQCRKTSIFSPMPAPLLLCLCFACMLTCARNAQEAIAITRTRWWRPHPVALSLSALDPGGPWQHQPTIDSHVFAFIVGAHMSGLRRRRRILMICPFSGSDRYQSWIFESD